MPEEMVHGHEATEHVYQPATKAGDVLIFSEAATHGSLPWTRADKQRRIPLFRFSPGNVAYGRNYMAVGQATWPEKMYNGLTEAQAAVLQPPFAGRMDRQLVVPAAGAWLPNIWETFKDKQG